MLCRSCGASQFTSFVDLGMTPNANSFRSPSQIGEGELFLPLTAAMCNACKLVQLEDHKAADYFFNDTYPYFSSWSESWLDHARMYAEAMIAQGYGGSDSLVVEIASNDGYLLQYFASEGVRVLGVDPAANCADVARDKHGIETIVGFFGRELATTLVNDVGRADLMVANNVLAHTPDPNDFIAGFKVLLAAKGLATFEFPHLLELIKHRQFDTIYHEHFSYFSLLALAPLLSRNGLRISRVEKLPTHGGSLRVYVQHADMAAANEPSVATTLAEEKAAGLAEAATYKRFGREVERLKWQLLTLLIGLKESDAKIAGCGAPAKGNTLLNYCGIGKDIVDFTVDRSTWKQGLLLPGTGIPIYQPSAIDEFRPDYVLVLPWNIKEEMMDGMAGIHDWGGRFIIPIPEPQII